MPLLTRENLDQNSYRYADWQTYERGKAYYQNGRVELFEFDGESATCRVLGEKDRYTVVVMAASRERVNCSCNCPQAARTRVCKHMVAAMLAVREYIKDNAEKSWQYRLGLALEKTPRKIKAKKEAERVIAVLGLEVNKLSNGEYSSHIYPFKVAASRWPGVQTVEAFNSPTNAVAYLDENRTWVRFVESPNNKPIDFGSAVNLLPEGLHVFNLMLSNPYYYGYGGISQFFQYLPLIEKLDLPLFLMKDRTFKERLHVRSEPATIEAALAFDGKNYTLQAGARVDDKIYSMVKNSLKILSASAPAWALAGQTIVPIANLEALEMLRYFPMTIPQEDEQRFRDFYFQPIAERMPITGEIVSWIDIDADPLPRLYLTKDEGSHLQAALKFAYGDYEVDAHPKAQPISMFDIPGTWGAVRIHRRLERELHFYDLLTEAKYGLKRAGASEPGMFEIRARTHPFDFLMYCVPALTKAGFEIFGDRDLGKVNRNPPKISLSITSGIDWFDVQAVVQYGDQEVPLLEIRKALKRGEKYVKLADGSIGQIPEQWLEKYKHLFEMAEETEDGLRVSDLQLSLVDELLADAEQANVVPEFHQKRERLKGFTNIEKQSLPAGFSGELRPYQQSGLDWLHFLNEYGFGGILADDMGLGKTIQVLAFLQSLKEKTRLSSEIETRSSSSVETGLSSNVETGSSSNVETQGGNASLLVVPKSLLANWQREAAKFTPQLKFLEFMGNFRKKDLSIFQEYDIILTTYGTMLRDIEFLREYRFNYVVLDESQAVKNPLAQSSKAARLLNAEHRLCMTGTPVENNTFELWSQFAFLNPGLLGNLEYFKREFATPIESREANSSASLLKRMVYPFILRRTKQQVAPELPPRTERIIYTDLEPAQRKLYNHTRDHYRGMLMGMLEEGEIGDVRMKILEGLLRLRQICIHPQLVEPTYKGEAAKFEILLETLETLQAEGHKALIFSQFVQTLHLLETFMVKQGLSYTYLDGQTKDRQERVDKFQNDDSISFFLISLKAGGVGLNLTAADYVIHLDPWWNPAVEMQAADRAHRIGQEKPVFIYKFIARETVEEKILQLQERKKELVEQLISAEGSFFKSMTKEDVKVLFS